MITHLCVCKTTKVTENNQSISYRLINEGKGAHPSNLLARGGVC